MTDPHSPAPAARAAAEESVNDWWIWDCVRSADAGERVLALITALRAQLAAAEQERDRVSEALDIGEDAQLGCTRAAAILSSVGVSDPDGTIVGMVGNAMDLIVSLRAQLAAAEQERDAIRSCVEVPDGALDYDRFFEIVREGTEAKREIESLRQQLATARSGVEITDEMVERFTAYAGAHHLHPNRIRIGLTAALRGGA